MSEHIDIVFDGPPEAVSGRFVEVENSDGASIRIGEWLKRDDGFWVLRIKSTDRICVRHFGLVPLTVEQCAEGYAMEEGTTACIMVDVVRIGEQT